jgi:phage protein D
MPFDAPMLFVELLDFDSGDDEVPTWNPYSQETQIQNYLTTRLISFTFSDDDRKKDQCVFQFRNEDLVLLDAPAFVKGQKFLVTFGWPGAMSMPRRMVVVGVKGASPVEVTCHCTLELLDLEPKTRREEGLTDSEFVRKVAAEYGYTGTLVDIEETSVAREVLIQPNLSDARMLHRLAVQNGFIFYMDETGLHWHKRRTDLDPLRSFIYQGDPGVGSILETPSIEIKLDAGVKTVRVLARDPVTGAPVVGEAGSAESGATSLGNEDMAGDLGTEISNRIARATGDEEHAGGIMTQAEAQAAAEARYRETAIGRYKMELKILGDAQLPAKSIVDVWGVADTFDGLYYVQAAEHEITPGSYVTTLKLVKDALREVKASHRAEVKGARHPKAAGGGPAADPNKLSKMLALTTGPNGEVTACNIFADPTSTKGAVAASAATWTDVAALAAEDRQAFVHYLNQTALPDA